MSLDSPTLAGLSILIGVEVSIGMSLFGYVLGVRPGLRAWTLGLWCFTAGLLVMTLREMLYAPVGTIVGNSLLLLGMAYVWVGARHYFDRPAPMRWAWASVGAGAAWLAWFLFVTPSPAMRAAGMSVGTLAWALAGAWVFLRDAPAPLRLSSRIAAFSLVAYAVFHFARLFFPLGVVEHGVARGGWPVAASYVAGIVAAIAWVLTLVSLTSDRLLDQLSSAARIDALTGVFNRGTLELFGRRAVATCGRRDISCAVLLFDLDHFKQINDTRGHAAGDSALRHFASLVSGQLRGSDVFGRHGGEEFCLVMTGAGVAEARMAAERLRDLVANTPPTHDGHSFPLTVSVGIAAGKGMAFHALLREADGALYAAKAGGRNRVLAAGMHLV